MILEIYTWMQEISSEVINCEIQNRFITADDENSVVFNNNLCLVKMDKINIEDNFSQQHCSKT